MDFQDFKDPNMAKQWDADTIRNNPSRPEQLDMLLTLVTDEYQSGKTILDLGIGSGLVEEMLFQRLPAAQVVGVDASSAMMSLAHERLKAYSSQYLAFEHDLTQIQSLQLPPHAYQVVFSVQTLHHLTDEQMQSAYRFIFNLLESGGLFLLLDRIAVERDGLYRSYQSLWKRQDRLYGSNVTSSEGKTFADHQQIVRERGDLPMGLERHLQLLREVGFESACLHLQTNRALIAARKT